MKKLFGIALVLALAFTLCLNTTALAWDFELQEADGATAEWTDETAAVGDYSVRLDWPAPYKDADNNYIVPRASVVITDSPDLAIGDVDSWSYWIYAPKSYAPNLTFYTDTVGDGSSDTSISAWPMNTPDNEWFLVDETTIGGYKGAYIVWSSNPWPSWKFDWSAVQGNYDEAEILNMLIGKGVIGTNQDITVFVDDFTINGITYRFEPPPPPPPPPSVAPRGMNIGSPWDGFLGAFAVGICTNDSAKITMVHWVEAWQQGKTLRDDLVEVGTSYASVPPTTYMLVIPAGTVVEGFYGGQLTQFTLRIVGGEFYFSPSVKFSNPATLYQLDGEEWVEVLRFDQVVSHKASLSVPTVNVSD